MGWGPTISCPATAELLPRLCSRDMVVEEEFGVPFSRGCALSVGKHRARS